MGSVTLFSLGYFKDTDAIDTMCVLQYTTLHYTILHYTTLHYTTLHYTTLHYTALHYTTLHHTTPHDSIMYYINVHCTRVAYHSILDWLHYAQEPSSHLSNPHKYILYGPTAAQLALVLATTLVEQPAGIKYKV